MLKEILFLVLEKFLINFLFTNSLLTSCKIILENSPFVNMDETTKIMGLSLFSTESTALNTITVNLDNKDNKPQPFGDSIFYLQKKFFSNCFLFILCGSLFFMTDFKISAYIEIKTLI